MHGNAEALGKRVPATSMPAHEGKMTPETNPGLSDSTGAETATPACCSPDGPISASASSDSAIRSAAVSATVASWATSSRSLRASTRRSPARLATATRTISRPKSIPRKPPEEGLRLKSRGGRPPVRDGACRAASARSMTAPSSRRSAISVDTVSMRVQSGAHVRLARGAAGLKHTENTRAIAHAKRLQRSGCPCHASSSLYQRPTLTKRLKLRGLYLTRRNLSPKLIHKRVVCPRIGDRSNRQEGPGTGGRAEHVFHDRRYRVHVCA